MNESKRLEVYDALPEVIKKLYSSSIAATLNRKMVEKYKIPETSVDTFLETTGDVILGFYNTTELTELLQTEVGVSADVAQRIFSDLQEFLAPVIAREKGEINPNHEELTKLQETFTPAQSQTSTETIIKESSTPSPQQKQTLGGLDSVQGVQSMRTMEGDMNRIHGYGAYRAQFPDEVQEAKHTEEVIRSASQEDLLTEKPKLARMPTYKDKEGV